MIYEVEQKFPVASCAVVEQHLRSLGAEISPPHTEIDRYFNHPARDFAQTDEALRLRQKGDHLLVTYKGPKLDPHSKTRRELERPLPANTLDEWNELLWLLGFQPVAEVRKSRRKAYVAWEGRQVEVSLDDVAEVGQFVELELTADAAGLDVARACIAALARRLDLSAGERRSYLELLLTRRGVR